MKSLARGVSIVLLLAVAAAVAPAQDPAANKQDAAANKQDPAPPNKFEAATKDAKVHAGLFKLYEKEGKLLIELASGNLNRDYIILISIARGISEGQLLGGMSWGRGDDWLWQFRKVDDNIHIVRRNVRFTAKSNSPEEKAVQLAYTDSVLYSLPIAAKSPSGGMLIDVTPVFMSDLPQIGLALRGYAFVGNRSTWAKVSAYPKNVELEVAATYASSGASDLDTVPDTRGVTINVHYSISELPSTGFQPRAADDRVGYFITAIKDFSKKGEQDRFVRYANRWDLQKSEPDQPLSPPKKPIIFWLEKTIPYAYRKPIREGILEWNKAYEKVGFANAIEVRQQPDEATWDPESIDYNTFRWITAGAGFAMGPSRVNPTNGQILDADIIFDADFVQFWKEEYETFTPAAAAALTGGPLDVESYLKNPFGLGQTRHCSFNDGFAWQFAFASTVAKIENAAQSKEMEEKLILQGLKEVTMHEVGHTLGLRHNFKASAFLPLADLNNVEKTSATGLTASVMDYSPPNIAPKGTEQGLFYSSTIGPYDYWAIEY
ncbi:MAG: zinc-dependent metalloprotease, partial [Planctomycetia bacterium]|nr:zinc-dependent metalloprotease [Planctomycetia bacterium]